MKPEQHNRPTVLRPQRHASTPAWWRNQAVFLASGQKWQSKRAVCLLTGFCTSVLACLSGPVRAESSVNPQALEGTRRIAIVAPFFCTLPSPKPVRPQPANRKPLTGKQAGGKPVARIVWPNTPTVRKSTRTASANNALQPARVRIEPITPTPHPTASSAPSATASSHPVPLHAETAFYADALKSLAVTMQTALPESLASGAHYSIVPDADTRQALRALHWQAQDLYVQQGKLDNGKFPVPDAVRIQQLARRLHVDAVLVAAMREPASIGDGIRLPFELWKINPLNLNMRRMRPHVLSPRVQAFLITAQGVTAWQDEQMADHPRTNPHTLKTLLIDWQEATEQVAQQLVDSLQRASFLAP